MSLQQTIFYLSTGFLLLFSACDEEDKSLAGGTGTFIDKRDGREYKWTKIGGQVWMGENLKAIAQPDGTPIPSSRTEDGWVALTEADGFAMYLPYEFQLADSAMIYESNSGFIYSWKTAMNGSTEEGAQGICPNGWHLPTRAEWEALLSNFDPNTLEAEIKLMVPEAFPEEPEAGTLQFNHMPDGIDDQGRHGRYHGYWSSSPQGNSQASILHGFKNIYLHVYERNAGLCVRCIKD